MTAVAERLPITLAARPSTEGVVVVMPAYGEEANLADTVNDFLTTLDGADIAHAVVVVNDGSSDGTGQVLDQLAAAHPGKVFAVHHETNQGYGAAVRTGIAAALEQTDLRQVLLTDSDGQFRAADLLTFLRVQKQERAEAVIGYREHRADPLRRKVNAWIWTRISRLVLRIRSRDVDCAYKLIDRRLLENIRLTGEAAAISPELVARISIGNTRVVEHPVAHYPRVHGQQTGANLAVILRSLASLVMIYVQLIRAAHKQPWIKRLLRPKDPALTAVTLAAIVLSVAGYLYFLDSVLAYKDANSHLLIARRVLESPTSGLAQLGGVWLPLPHLLSMPLVWNDYLYQTGLAGSIVSMLAFVVTIRYLYRLGTDVAGSRLGGLAVALLFAVNANALYLQATAMTESLLFACIAGSAYYLHLWCKHGHYSDLVATSAGLLLATLTRYEGWVLCLAAAVVVAYTELRRHRDYFRLEASLIFFGCIAFAGIAGWLVWNTAIFGNPFYWQTGEYARPELWSTSGDPAVGNLLVAAKVYFLAMLANIGPVTLGAGALGVVAHLVRHRLRPQAGAPYALLVFVPFFIYAIYVGQRPLYLNAVHDENHNVRFGLVMLLGVAVFAGYLVSLVPLALSRLRMPQWQRLGKGLVTAGVLASALAVPGVITLEEAVGFRGSAGEQPNAAAAAWLRDNYDDGLILMMSFQNESVTFDSQVPTGAILYEGSYLLWEQALANPTALDVEWIYMRAEPGREDQVWQELYGTAALKDNYELAYGKDDRLIYRLREGLS